SRSGADARVPGQGKTPHLDHPLGHRHGAGSHQLVGHLRPRAPRVPGDPVAEPAGTLRRLRTHSPARRGQPGICGTTTLRRTRSPDPPNAFGTTTPTKPHDHPVHRVSANGRRRFGTPGCTTALRTHRRPTTSRYRNRRRTRCHPADVTPATG